MKNAKRLQLIPVIRTAKDLQLIPTAFRYEERDDVDDANEKTFLVGDDEVAAEATAMREDAEASEYDANDVPELLSWMMHLAEGGDASPGTVVDHGAAYREAIRTANAFVTLFNNGALLASIIDCGDSALQMTRSAIAMFRGALPAYAENSEMHCALTLVQHHKNACQVDHYRTVLRAIDTVVESIIAARKVTQ